MEITIMILKLVWIIVIGYEGIVFYKNCQQVKGLKFELDLVSWMEIGTTLGLGLVLMGSRPTKNSFLYMIIFIVGMIVIHFFEIRRLIIVGDRLAIIRNQIIEIDTIETHQVRFMTLTLKTSEKRINVTSPLSKRTKINELLAISMSRKEEI